MILGLALSHNATACLLDPDSGKVLFCCSEERFSRRKNEWGIPRCTLDYIFRHLARPGQITRVTLGESCRSRWGSAEFARLMYLAGWDEKDSYLAHKPRLAWAVFKNALGKMVSPHQDYRGLVAGSLAELGLRAPISYYDHHTAHAASAYYCSPFDQALVITLDGEGDRLSGSSFVARRASLQRLATLPEIASAGKFYRAVTSMLGFTVNRHEGKVTGLAAYGDPERFAPLFRRLLLTEKWEDRQRRIVSKVAEDYLKSFSLRNVSPLRLWRFAWLALSESKWEGLLNKMLRRYFRDTYGPLLGLDLENLSFQDMADVSAAAQQVLEEVVVDYVGAQQELAPSPNLALAGGIFANVKLNQRLLERLSTQEIYIHPGMGDEGLALGGAMLALHEERAQKAPGARLDHVFLGPAYPEAEIRAALEGSPFTWEKADRDTIAETVAQALVQERIVGLFNGALEYGPRALGHRTILVNPVKREINDIVNQRLRRSEFMPFAPVVLDRCYEEIFDSPKLAGARQACRYMTITLDVKPEWARRIQGVVHVDRTARPQVIAPEDDPLYYAIVERFHQKTGIGCVVNTSFNVHEEPIVNSPADAVKSYRDDAVDLLVMGDYLVRKP